jgi:uncharacterized damage-inducible protein DinB
MIDTAHCRLMAAYNTGMNRRIYDAAARIPDAERRADRGAFFGSLHGTLSHLVWTDHAWMVRFAPGRWERLPGTLKDSPHAFPDWDEMCAARRKADAGIEEWAAGVDDAWLAAPLTWLSGASGREMTKPAWVTVVHLFNHQTHHRGQAHCLITQQGVTPEDTDLPWVVDLAALGLA